MSEEVKNVTEEVKQEGDFKIKKKPGRPKKLTSKEDVTKLNLKKEEDAVQESSTEKVDVDAKSGDGGKVGETHVESAKSSNEGQEEKEKIKDEVNPIEEIKTTEEKVVEKEPVEPVAETIKTPEVPVLPENVEKLVSFMEETGGTLEDYVRLNRDYSKLNNEQLLREYYKQTKPYLTNSEITFHMEGKFAWDEEEDSEQQITEKKIILKEELAKANKFLEDTKSKYYDEIKLRPNVTQEQKKAMDFYNMYSQEQEQKVSRHENFKNTTNNFFKDFEGFEFKVGEKSFKYNVKNSQDVAQKQSNLADFVGKFQNENGEINDYNGYHKALYTARNADRIAHHFYEQGKADAVKDITSKSNNVNTSTQQQAPGDMFINGYKVRAISGDDSSRLKIKTRK